MKTESHLELVTPKIKQLIVKTESRITKLGKNVPHLEIKEVILVHCDIVNNGY